jgi:hypothetical protein
VGHHPHVTQGIERIGSAVVAYSLGNLVFSNFEWEYRGEDGTPRKTMTILSDEDRQGVVLEMARSADASLAVSLQPTRMDPERGVQRDPAPAREEEIEALSAALLRPSYRLWWYIYAMRREWVLRIARTVSPKRLLTKWHKIRLRHLSQLIGSLRRSTKIVSEKSMNPYE